MHIGLEVEGAAAEPSDRCEDVVGSLGPAEGLGIGVAGIDIGADGRLQLFGRPVSAAFDLLFGQQREEALDLVDPGRGGRGEVGMPVRTLGEPVADQLGLVIDALSMMTWMSRSRGRFLSTASRKRRNSAARWRDMHWPMIVPAFTSSAANNEVVPCRL